MTKRTLQSGIYFEQDATPHPSYRLVLLNAAADAESPQLRDGLEAVTAMLANLAKGHVRGLEGEASAAAAESRQQYGDLDVLVGYGRRFFDESEHESTLTKAQRPDFLSYLPRVGPFPALPWAAKRRSAEADIALQLTGLNEAAVNCAAIEVWKLIRQRDLPWAIAESFAGYGRSDKRGWLGFHDGVSNMSSDQRPPALLACGDPGWMLGGTYMAYLRIHVDLEVWESKTRTEQELMVGRDKLSGAAIIGVEDTDGEIVPVAAAAPGKQANTADRAKWRDPPQTTDAILENSHIARANQTRASAAAPGSFRLFRQGYDYLEAVGDGTAELGLNFVAFQRDLRVVQQLLHLPGWLGDANFGGTADDAAPRLLSVVAGGFYAVPPNEKPFAGASLFGAN
jgi:Dyp-type peroxidase family